MCLLIRTGWVTLLVLVCLATGFSQSGGLPNNKYAGKSLKTYAGRQLSGFGRFSAFVGYYHHDFYLTDYSKSLATGSLKRTISWCTGMRYIAYPVMLDAKAFYARYKVEENGSKHNISYKGIESSLSLIVLPQAERLSKYVLPYVGAGVDWGELRDSTVFDHQLVFGNLDGFKPDVDFTMLNLFWKVGLGIRVTRDLSLIAEYKQSFKANGWQSDAKGRFPYRAYTLGFALKGKSGASIATAAGISIIANAILQGVNSY